MKSYIIVLYEVIIRFAGIERERFLHLSEKDREIFNLFRHSVNWQEILQTYADLSDSQANRIGQYWFNYIKQALDEGWSVGEVLDKATDVLVAIGGGVVGSPLGPWGIAGGATAGLGLFKKAKGVMAGYIKERITNKIRIDDSVLRNNIGQITRVPNPFLFLSCDFRKYAVIAINIALDNKLDRNTLKDLFSEMFDSEYIRQSIKDKSRLKDTFMEIGESLQSNERNWDKKHALIQHLIQQEIPSLEIMEICKNCKIGFFQRKYLKYTRKFRKLFHNF